MVLLMVSLVVGNVAFCLVTDLFFGSLCAFIVGVVLGYFMGILFYFGFVSV